MITASIFVLAFMAFSVMETEGNHPGSHHHHHHGGHNHQNHQSQVGTPVQPPNSYVSSFSHSLPGTGSYISVTRYFNSPVGGAVVAPSNLDLDHNQSQRLGKNLDQDHNQSSRLSKGDPLSDQPQDEYYDPWNPRFKVQRIDVSDDDWEEHLQEIFEESGLLGSQLLKRVPKGLVNLNYDIHICVHMGTELTPDETVYPPTISYPGEGESAGKLHTILLMDAELNKLHWMVMNIPGAKVHNGTIVTAYASPNPAQNTGNHRYIVLVMEQPSLINDDSVTEYKTESSCQTRELTSLDFTNFKEKFNLSEPVAANYFIQKYEPFIEDINSHCLRDIPIQPHPLYK